MICQSCTQSRILAHEVRINGVEKYEQLDPVPEFLKLLCDLVGDDTESAAASQHVWSMRHISKNRLHVCRGFYGNIVAGGLSYFLANKAHHGLIGAYLLHHIYEVGIGIDDKKWRSSFAGLERH